MWDKLGGRKFVAYIVGVAFCSIGFFGSKQIPVDDAIWLLLAITSIYLGINLGEKFLGYKQNGNKK